MILRTSNAICDKCGRKLIPSVGNELICPNCNKQYTAKFNESRPWGGVG